MNIKAASVRFAGANSVSASTSPGFRSRNSSWNVWRRTSRASRRCHISPSWLSASVIAARASLIFASSAFADTVPEGLRFIVARLHQVPRNVRGDWKMVNRQRDNDGMGPKHPGPAPDVLRIEGDDWEAAL